MHTPGSWSRAIGKCHHMSSPPSYSLFTPSLAGTASQAGDRALQEGVQHAGAKGGRVFCPQEQGKTGASGSMSPARWLLEEPLLGQQETPSCIPLGGSSPRFLCRYNLVFFSAYSGERSLVWVTGALRLDLHSQGTTSILSSLLGAQAVAGYLHWIFEQLLTV